MIFANILIALLGAHSRFAETQGKMATMDMEHLFVKRAQLNLRSKEYQIAMANCTKAIEVRPDYCPAYFYRGKAKYDLGDYQGAIADFTKAIQMKLDFAEGYRHRALAKTSIADYQGAVDDLTKTLKLNGDDAEAYFDRAVAYLGVGQKSEAFAGFERAMKLGYRIPPELMRMLYQLCMAR
jgi:tetratricopeptide (TPR) repeat protein